ncbi:MAG TPA: mannose-6-phosphate isomerase, class I [Pilimelia sp.]|nr:mannose-6-phosphate isomerase, class I [Pilimelia sp.]
MEPLVSPIRAYAWGSRTAIATLQGRPVPSPGPEAELWLGAHPGDPSALDRPAGRVSLADAVRAAPAELLGTDTAERFGPRLPYLLKFLAAEQPLSLQAHPDAEQARAGHAAEEAAGAAERNYADPFHKPELLVAVSPFEALCGFRAPGESAELLDALGVVALKPVVEQLHAGDLAGAARSLLTWPGAERPAVVRAVAQAAGSATDGPFATEYAVARRLADAYPDDIGVVVSLLLNVVTLAPGEAIWMPAGNLHAYLRGSGVEIMAASDNVLRGGLTPKRVDVPELLRVLRFEPLADPVVRAGHVGPGVVTWPTPVAEFALYRAEVAGETASVPAAGPRIALCLAGEVTVDDGDPVRLRAGEAAFGAAVDRPLSVSGEGTVFVAGTAA